MEFRQPAGGKAERSKDDVQQAATPLPFGERSTNATHIYIGLFDEERWWIATVTVVIKARLSLVGGRSVVDDEEEERKEVNVGGRPDHPP